MIINTSIYMIMNLHDYLHDYEIKTLNISFVCMLSHILSAYLSFHVILGYDLKIYHFRDNYA